MFKPYLFWQTDNRHDKAGRNQRKKAAYKASKKPQARRKEQRDSIRIEVDGKWVSAIMVIMLISMAVYLMPKEQWLPIKKIRISGTFQHLDSMVIQQQLQPYLGQGFFSLDIQRIQQAISQQAWVKSVSVRRIWPSLIDVRVEEKTALARWDDQHLLSAGALIFAADTADFSRLPRINGYSKQTRELLDRYNRLQQQFDSLSIRLTSMVEDSKGSLTLELDNRLTVSLGAGDNELKLKHLIAVYPQYIQPKLEFIEKIDFRYSNGFAIAWKAQYLEKMQRGSNNV